MGAAHSGAVVLKAPHAAELPANELADCRRMEKYRPRVVTVASFAFAL
jgi:hypothetical protein